MAIYEYRTEPLTNFAELNNQKAYEEGLEKVKKYLGREYPLIINGERVFTDKQIISVNPSKHSEVIGKISQAGMEEAKLAMSSALETFEYWKKVNPKVRADVLFKAANIMKT